MVKYRSGDMWAPQLEQGEALKTELDYFVDCVNTLQRPFNDGQAGYRIVKMLEAANRSLKKQGEIVRLSMSEWATRAPVSAAITKEPLMVMRAGA